MFSIAKKMIVNFCFIVLLLVLVIPFLVMVITTGPIFFLLAAIATFYYSCFLYILHFVIEFVLYIIGILPFYFRQYLQGFIFTLFMFFA
uniref:Uncharacterized protein n=1 Tax=Meloidogyne enterolobii TaxID=390850 RepID=A0A6V7VFG2_MELEN|nr:unnamed protein product [Meloidogyne enterolobii]